MRHAQRLRGGYRRPQGSLTGARFFAAFLKKKKTSFLKKRSKKLLFLVLYADGGAGIG
jgi:hypothetical protein